MLYYLARHGGQVFTIRQIYEAITLEDKTSSPVTPCSVR